MNNSTGLRIWIMIAHALILIGMGHGIATMGVVEVMWLGRLFSPIDPVDGHDVSDLSLRIVAVLCLLGQVTTIWSIRSKNIGLARNLHIIGICTLWLSVLTYAWSIRHDDYSHLATVTCIPFALITVWSLFGTRIRYWVRRKGRPEVE